MFETTLSFTIPQVLAASCFFLCVALPLYFSRKCALRRRDFGFILLFALLFVLLSLLFKYKTFSGMGVAHKYGLPHDFYTTWVSFDNSEVRAGFSLFYILPNILFYYSLLFALFILINLRRK
jgi:hypothetical protein